MFGKRTRFVTMMAAALGVPYAWFNESLSSTLRNTWSSLQGTISSVTSGRSDSSSFSPPWSIEQRTYPVSVGSAQAAPVNPTIHQLVEVLRFDITPRWVIDHWGRVSTVHAEHNLEGLRVPLVTGTNLNDIAGSLTYYFDEQQRVRRIRLHGHTGDERTLVDLVTKHFGMRQEPTWGAGTYINRWNAKPMNVLRIAHAPVIRANAPNTRLAIELELNDLQANFGLSPDFAQQLLADQYIHAPTL